MRPTLIPYLVCFLFICKASFAQILTKEDSLNNSLLAKNTETVLSGYGEGRASYTSVTKTGSANLTRAVLFVGHKFSNTISFFSETEVEDAKVDGGGGEIALEQAFLKIQLNKDLYLTTGLFIPRLGIINENHLPTTFNGVDRPFTETYIIPSTWRELGIGLYGSTRSIPGLNYSLGIVNGLNSEHFNTETGIREGRFEGRDFTGNNIALTGSLLYYFQHFRIQASEYYGGTTGIAKRMADSLQLNHGPFGSPLSLTEGDIQYTTNGLTVKALASFINIAEADKIIRAFNQNVPSQLYGFYAEIGYNLLNHTNTEKKLVVFARYEKLDMNYKVPAQGISDGALKQQYIIAGLNFLLHRGIAFKADYVMLQTGDQNPLLVQNQYNSIPYSNRSNTFNIGFGYSF